MPGWISVAVLLVLTVASFLPGTDARAFDYNDQQQDGTSRYIGRVQMKVFRGPTAQSGDWAPHGFWVRQPADSNK